MRGWRPINDNEYKNELDDKLKSLPTYNSDGTMAVELATRCKQIEDILLEVADKCQEKSKVAEEPLEKTQARFHELIGQRRSARATGCKDLVKNVGNGECKEKRADIQSAW